MRRAALLLCSLLIPAVLALSQFSAWADDAPPQSGPFLTYCKMNRKGCSDKIAEINFAMMITAPIDRKWCPGNATTNDDALTSKVVQWLAAHPEAANKTTNEGIELALSGLYPCKR